jgi:flagellar M-ring protein FliF
MLRSFGIARVALIVGATIGVALAMGLIVLRVNAEPMALLYSDLDLADGQDLAARLDQENVKYEIRERNGAVSIFAPRGDVLDLRLKLAGDGFVARGGAVGYEIFDKQDPLGSTSFQQNINRLRALEGELARTIATISGVRSARVHLVLPERELFSRERQEASASIVIDAPGGLDKRSVRAIVNLTASAAPGLSPSRVTVLDSAGELLASGQADGDPLASGVDERIAATEARIRRTVEDIVGRIVGPDNLRVQVSADIDFSRVTETANIIDPDSQTVLSETTVEDVSNSNDPAIARGVSVANQLPEAALVDPQSVAAATSSARRTEETTNYEMTRTVRNEIREMGGVKRLSVAVALNQATARGADGALIPAPRSAEEMARLTALVRSAVGYDAARGDQVNVVETPFLAPEIPPAAGVEPGASAFDPALLMRATELAALALVALSIIFFILRPMINARAPAPAAALREPIGAVAPAARPAPAAGALENLIDLAQVDGKVKASSLKRVSEVVKAHKDESAGILKSWIREAS